MLTEMEPGWGAHSSHDTRMVASQAPSWRQTGVGFGFSNLPCASIEEANAMAKPLLRLLAKRRLKKAFLQPCSTSSLTLWREPDGNPGPCTSWPSEGAMLLAETRNKALVFKDISIWPASHESCLGSVSANCSFALLIGLVVSGNNSISLFFYISISLCLYICISI